MPDWERVRLGDLLIPVSSDRRENVQPDKEYRLLGVRLSNEGPFLRETKKGSDSSASSLFQVREGDFIYSRLFAWRGALGLIPLELDGCYVSNEFPLFTARDERIDLEYLNYWFHLTDVTRIIEADCTGSTPLTRNRYKENFFLALEIPLPPLPEQRRIVARIKSMLDKVEEAEQLVAEIPSDLSSLAWSIHNAEPTKHITMRELVSLRPPDVHVDPSETYHFAGVYSFGRGVFVGQSKLGADFAYPKLTRLRAGDFTYPKLMAWEGAFGIATDECDGLVVSTEFPVFSINTAMVLPEVLDSHFKNPAVWPMIAGDSTGTNVRRRRLNPSDFLDYAFPLPSRTAQEKIVAAWRTRANLFGQPIRREELAALPASILARAFAGEL